MDILGSVHGGDKGGFKLRRSEKDAAIKHVPEERGVLLCVGAFRVGVVVDALGSEEESGQRADGVDSCSGVCLRDSLAKTGDQAIGVAAEFIVDARRFELLERSDSRSHRERISSQRTGLVDGAERSDLVHEFSAATVGSNRNATTDNLAERGEVCLDFEELLSGAVVEAEASNDLVGDEKRAVLAGNVAKTGEEAFGRNDDAHIGCDRLNDNGGDFVFVLREQMLDCGEVIVWSVEGELGESLGHTWTFGDSERGEAGTGLREEAVGMTVIAAFEFEEKIALGD